MASLYQLRQRINTRTGRNVIFWLCVFAFLCSINLSEQVYNPWLYVLYKALSISILAVMSTVNNLILVPNLLVRKKRLLFILSAMLLTIITACVYVFLFLDMKQRFPEMEPYQVSIITSPITQDWTWTSLLQDVLVFTVGLDMWIVSFTMAWYMNDYARQQKLAKDALLKQRETELSLLRNQVNPHFLFNTLNNIYGLALAKSDDAPESILKLSSIMRYMLYDSDEPLMPVGKEKEVMQAYIDMELLRLPKNDNLKFSIEVDKNYNIPTLIWLPILENVFKHATRVITDNYFINYSFTIKDGILSIVSENSYKDLPQKEGGVGLNNLRKRLEIVYPKMHKIVEVRQYNKYSIKLTVNL